MIKKNKKHCDCSNHFGGGVIPKNGIFEGRGGRNWKQSRRMVLHILLSYDYFSEVFTYSNKSVHQVFFSFFLKKKECYKFGLSLMKKSLRGKCSLNYSACYCWGWSLRCICARRVICFVECVPRFVAVLDQSRVLPSNVCKYDKKRPRCPSPNTYNYSDILIKLCMSLFSPHFYTCSRLSAILIDISYPY